MGKEYHFIQVHTRKIHFLLMSFSCDFNLMLIRQLLNLTKNTVYKILNHWHCIQIFIYRYTLYYTQLCEILLKSLYVCLTCVHPLFQVTGYTPSKYRPNLKSLPHMDRQQVRTGNNGHHPLSSGAHHHSLQWFYTESLCLVVMINFYCISIKYRFVQIFEFMDTYCNPKFPILRLCPLILMHIFE